LQQRQDDLVNLRTQEQQSAQQALIKLASIAAIPTVGGILGVGLLIFLAIQWLITRQDSMLGAGLGTTWETPWDGEIIWQVMIVGFFFISQILLPLIVVPILVKVVGLNLVAMGLRGKAVTVLVSYLIMALGGLVVLYFSLKPFFPLTEEWFRFQVKSKWILWGVGGYLVALPLVVLVSLLNQQIWQGQGGSNPIILLALQAQDRVALIIFFFTASIAAPVFEEIIFRGFFLPSLTRYLPVGASILISSLVFALAHLSLSEVLPLTTLGMILGFVYVRSRNLLAPILLHSLWNGGTLLSLFILGSGVQ
jgi:membrane protease YdiL (CAAX protease family)